MSTSTSITSTERAIICIDTSGSVSRNVAYWRIVDTIHTAYKQEYPNLTYVMWDSKHKVCDENEYKRHQLHQLGAGGTNPVEIVKACRSAHITKNICIITDGEVGASEVATADAELQKWKPLENVFCHIINTRPNLSVSCPFTRGNTSCVFTHVPTTKITHKETGGQHNIQEVLHHVDTKCVSQFDASDYTLLDKLDTLSWDLVEAQYETIQKLLLALNMGKGGNQSLKDKLVKTKANIIAEFSAEKTRNTPDTSTLIRTALQSNDIETAVSHATNLTKAYFETDNISEVNKKMDKLISLCGDLRNTFTTDCIASAKINRADYIEEKVIESNDILSFTNHNQNDGLTGFTCPILYDEDCPVLMIEKTPTGKPLLVGLDQNTVDFILECPLRLLNTADLVARVKPLMAQVVGGTYAMSSRSINNPFTRNELLGFIPLGVTQNCVDVGNFVLATLFTGSKKVGNMDLWLCALYLIAKEIPHLHDHMQCFSDHLKWRLSTTKTYASLTGLVTLPTTKLNTDIAMWYIFASSAHITNGASDPIRFHLPHIVHLQTLVTLCFGDHVLTPQMLGYVQQCQIMMRALKHVKISPKHHTHLKSLCTALYQRSMLVKHDEETVVVLIDGAPSTSNITDVKHLLGEILHMDVTEMDTNVLYGCLCDVHPSKSAGAIMVSQGDIPLPIYTWDWTEKHIANLDFQVPMSYNTFRPASTFYDETVGRVLTWQESAMLRYGYDETNPSDHFNGIKYFTMYMIAHTRVPTFEQYASFCFQLLQHRKPTLPSCIEEIYRSDMKSYAPYFKRAQAEGLTVKDIANRMFDSRFKKERQLMEAEYQKHIEEKH